MKTCAAGVVVVFAIVCIDACARESATNTSPAASTDPNLHVLALPEHDTSLPEAPGKSLTVGSCLTCHSTRYIADQPTFSRKTWTAEVEKMKKTYGAPIADESTQPIIDYLVATHGREE